MSCSLISDALPNDIAIKKQMNVQLGFLSQKTPKHLRANYQSGIRLIRLFLTVTKEAGKAILECHYKEFDALLRSYTCELTALKNLQLLRCIGLKEQAKRVQAKAQKKLEKSQKMFQSPPPDGDVGCDLAQYAKKIGLDLKMSPEMIQLVRFHLLKIVNTNVRRGNTEVPQTNISLLKSKESKSDRLPLKLIVQALQVEESAKAALFIKQEADLIKPEDTDRAALIQRMLNQEHWRKGNQIPITSVPLFYDTEAMLRRIPIDSLVVVQNKVTICGKAIEGALARKVCLRMHENSIVSDEELSKYGEDEPVIVIEGTISNEIPLEAKIQEFGLIEICNAGNAKHPQYASLVSQEPIDDAEALLDLKHYEERLETANVIEIDHISCVSKKESGL